MDRGSVGRGFSDGGFCVESDLEVEVFHDHIRGEGVYGVPEFKGVLAKGWDIEEHAVEL